MGLSEKEKESENRHMAFKEIFDCRVDYFRENEELFDDRQYLFLVSVLSYGDRISERQKQAFINIVDVVHQCQFRRRKK